jgi:hypothetical protein
MRAGTAERMTSVRDHDRWKAKARHAMKVVRY